MMSPVILNLDFHKQVIQKEIEQKLKNAGLFFRIFSRTKGVSSIKNKLQEKREKYLTNGEKMQDIIGVRIILYFIEDVDIVYKAMVSSPSFLSESNSKKEIKGLEKRDKIGSLTDKVFMPTRLNLIFRMDDRLSELLSESLVPFKAEFDTDLIDFTYEVQIRTVLSEGWHEVEHDIRYKTCNEEWWDYCDDESRMFNGIYASLETSEMSLKSLLSNIAYKNYRRKDWSAMIRNHLCLRLEDSTMPAWADVVFNKDSRAAKQFLSVNRSRLIQVLLASPIPFPLKLENMVYLVNRIGDKNEEIMAHESEALKTCFLRMGV